MRWGTVLGLVLLWGVGLEGCGARGRLQILDKQVNGSDAPNGTNATPSPSQPKTLEEELAEAQARLEKLQNQKSSGGKSPEEVKALEAEIAAANVKIAEVEAKLKARELEAKEAEEKLKAQMTVYELQYKHSMKCLQIEGAATLEGGRAQQFTCNQSNLQRFRFIPKAQGIWIQNWVSGKCLANRGASLENGTAVEQQACKDSPEHLFTLVSDGAGFTFLKHKASGRCVDIEAISLSDQAGAQLYDCLNGDAQRVKITSFSL